MKVKMSIELRAREVLLMHKNAPSLFIEHIYAFMGYYDCSRTQEEILGISTEELMKDMWYLNISPSSIMEVTRMESGLLFEMIHIIERCSGDDVESYDLFRTYVQVRMDSGEWENV